MRIVVFVLVLSFLPLSSTQASRFYMCSLEQDVKSLLYSRIKQYFNDNTDSAQSKHNNSEYKECSLLMFDNFSLDSYDFNELEGGKAEKACYLDLGVEKYLMPICSEGEKRWQKIECKLDKSLKGYRVMAEDSCFQSGKYILILFHQLNPTYFKNHWAKIVKLLSKEFKIHPAGLLMYNQNVKLIYL